MEENYLKKELYDLVKSDSTIFEFIQSGSLDGIWYWDLKKLENEWLSPKFWQTLGYDSSEKKHLSSEWQDIIFEEDLMVTRENFKKHCKDPSYPFDQIVRYRHRDGSTVWIRCRGMAIRDQSGKPLRMLGAHTDISDLKRAEAEVSRLSEEYERVFNGTQDAMFLIEVLAGGDFRFIRNNLSHQIKTGIELQQIAGKSPAELLGRELGAVVAANYKQCLDSRKSISYEEELNLPAGDRIWLTTLTPIIEVEGVSYIVGSAVDITERKKLELELEKYANYDKLTGLPNRRLFFEQLDRTIAECERYDESFALLFVDLDGFKSINDTHGHEVGDEVLIRAGNRLVASVRRSDTVARMGGDEFTLIIRGLTDKEDIYRVVDKLHRELKETMVIGNIECRVDSSIGIALYPENGRDRDLLLKSADSSMYDIKKNGKGGFKFTV